MKLANRRSALRIPLAVSIPAAIIGCNKESASEITYPGDVIGGDSAVPDVGGARREELVDWLREFLVDSCLDRQQACPDGEYECDDAVIDGMMEYASDYTVECLEATQLRTNALAEREWYQQGEGEYTYCTHAPIEEDLDLVIAAIRMCQADYWSEEAEALEDSLREYCEAYDELCPQSEEDCLRRRGSMFTTGLLFSCETEHSIRFSCLVENGEATVTSVNGQDLCYLQSDECPPVDYADCGSSDE